MKSGFT